MIRLVSPLVLALALAGALASPLAAQPFVAEPDHDFGRVRDPAALEHAFVLENRGPADLRVARVRLTPPWIVVAMASALPAGGSTRVTVRPTAPLPAGPFAAEVIVLFADGAAEPLPLALRGEIVPDLELDPLPAFYATTVRGRAATTALTLRNHTGLPLAVTAIEESSPRYEVEVETIVPDRELRIRLVLTGDGAAGREDSRVVLATTHPAHPRLEIPVHTRLRERVSTFPEEIDLGTLSRRAAGPGAAAGGGEISFMVYQFEGAAFEIAVETDVPFLELRPERSPLFTDRWQVFVRVDPARLRPWSGPGSIVVRTNDPEFAELRVPVRGQVD